MITVQKFGGSSLADAEKVARAAELVAEEHNKGNSVVVVVSAQGDTTDELTEKAKEINPEPPKRELDALLSAGEQMSASLLAMELESKGLRAVSLTGWQMGLLTDSEHGRARIVGICTGRIRDELERGRIVVAAGFQGVDESGEVTTLGRGGSDTTAVALAAALGAGSCQIYTDVDGVYTADPRKVPGTKRHDRVSYDEMLELASLGSQVLHNRCVELARRYGVELEVLSSGAQGGGTLVTEDAGRAGISGVTTDCGTAFMRVEGDAARVFETLSREGVSADMINVSACADGGAVVSFSVPAPAAETAGRVLIQAGFTHVETLPGTAKVSVAGAGMLNSAGVPARLLSALYRRGIAVYGVSSGELRVSVLVPGERAREAVEAIHGEFFPG